MKISGPSSPLTPRRLLGSLADPWWVPWTPWVRSPSRVGQRPGLAVGVGHQHAEGVGQQLGCLIVVRQDEEVPRLLQELWGGRGLQDGNLRSGHRLGKGCQIWDGSIGHCRWVALGSKAESGAWGLAVGSPDLGRGFRPETYPDSSTPTANAIRHTWHSVPGQPCLRIHEHVVGRPGAP